MAAACGVDVVVAGVPAHRPQVDPAAEAEDLGMDSGAGDRDPGGAHDQVFGPPRDLDVITARRQEDRLAVAPIDLGMEEQVGRPGGGRGDG